MDASSHLSVDYTPCSEKAKWAIHIRVMGRGKAILELLSPEWEDIAKLRFNESHIKVVSGFVEHSQKFSSGLVLWASVDDARKRLLYTDLREIWHAIVSPGGFKHFWEHHDLHILLRPSSEADVWLTQLSAEVNALWDLTKEVRDMLEREVSVASFSTVKTASLPSSPRSIWPRSARADSIKDCGTPRMSRLNSVLSGLSLTDQTTPLTPIPPSSPASPSDTCTQHPTDISQRRFLVSPPSFGRPFRESVASATEQLTTRLRRVLSFGADSGTLQGLTERSFQKLNGANPTAKHKATDSGVGSICTNSPPQPQSPHPHAFDRVSTEPFPDFAAQSIVPSSVIGDEPTLSSEELDFFVKQRNHTLTPRQSSLSIRSPPCSPLLSTTRTPPKRKGSTYSLFPSSTPTSSRAGSSLSSPMSRRQSVEFLSRATEARHWGQRRR